MPGAVVKQGVQRPLLGIQGGLQLLHSEGVDILVGVVQHGVEVGHHIHKAAVDLLHPLGEGAGELPRRLPGGLGSLGVDEVHDGLGLGQVQTAVEEGPPGKLPGAGLAGPPGKEGLQGQGVDLGGAVALELGGLLPGVAGSGGGPGAQDLVDLSPLPVVKGAVDQLPGRMIRQRPAVGGGKDPSGGGQGPGA